MPLRKNIVASVPAVLRLSKGIIDLQVIGVAAGIRQLLVIHPRRPSCMYVVVQQHLQTGCFAFRRSAQRLVVVHACSSTIAVGSQVLRRLECILAGVFKTPTIQCGRCGFSWNPTDSQRCSQNCFRQSQQFAYRWRRASISTRLARRELHETLREAFQRSSEGCVVHRNVSNATRPA